MQWVATGFVFRRIDSPFHSLDARVKLLISTQLLAISLIVQSIYHVALVLSAIIALSLTAKIIRRLGRTLTFSAGFAVIILAINILVGYSIAEAIFLASRFVAIVGSTSIFFLTASPDELENVMKWLRLPRDVVFAFVTAIRFVPVLMLDALQVMDAQKSRGLELEKGRFLQRIRNLAPILVPLVVDAVIRSGELAEAMEARAYGAIKKPTSLFLLRMSSRDWLTMAISMILFASASYLFLID